MKTKISTKNLITASILVSTLLLSQSVNAGLIARTITDVTFGNVDAYYDDVLDITWLKDANFAKTSGYAATGVTGVSADGQMRWSAANTWAGQLQIGLYNDWRLTSLQPQDGSTDFNFNYSGDGSSDRGYNITSSMHEMAYMFHVNLGLEGYCDGANNNPNNGGSYCDSSGTGWHNTALYTVIDTVNLGNNIAVDNLMSNKYWYDVEYVHPTIFAWAFNPYNGYQGHEYKDDRFYGWAVRSGDVGASTPPVSSVPEPTALAIFGLGLLGLVARRKKA